MHATPKPSDAQQIRDLIRTWLAASQAGDLDTVLSLMTEDVVFLVPGREPMRKAEFAALSRVDPGQPGPRMEGSSEIQEVVVTGDWAYAWTSLRVAVTPPGAAQAMVRAGHTLSVFRKENERWRLARDANLLVPVRAAT